jgi:hypothetical protein
MTGGELRDKVTNLRPNDRFGPEARWWALAFLLESLARVDRGDVVCHGTTGAHCYCDLCEAKRMVIRRIGKLT